jgi:hypothetical protein
MTACPTADWWELEKVAGSAVLKAHWSVGGSAEKWDAIVAVWWVVSMVALRAASLAEKKDVETAVLLGAGAAATRAVGRALWRAAPWGVSRDLQKVAQSAVDSAVHLDTRWAEWLAPHLAGEMAVGRVAWSAAWKGVLSVGMKVVEKVSRTAVTKVAATVARRELERVAAKAVSTALARAARKAVDWAVDWAEWTAACLVVWTADDLVAKRAVVWGIAMAAQSVAESVARMDVEEAVSTVVHSAAYLAFELAAAKVA